MKRALRVVMLLVSVFALAPILAQTPKPTKGKTDNQIKQEIISQSIGSYSGSCPCPYNRDRAGRSCGRRSAYSRPSGASPLCYPQDVTQRMVDDYRKRTKQE
jgi:hypothetical protein